MFPKTCLSLSPPLSIELPRRLCATSTKHAGETHVKVSLTGENGNVRMQVRDFGAGFDQDSDDYPTKGLGLVSMEERARIAGGAFSVSRLWVKGQTLSLRFPWMLWRTPTHE